MNKLKIKFNKFQLIGVAAWIVLGAVIGYEGYYLYGVRVTISSQEAVGVPLNLPKINQDALKQATVRFDFANGYVFTESKIPDPFALDIQAKSVPAQ